MSWNPLWPRLERDLMARQPERFRWPGRDDEGWIGPIHSPLRDDRNPSFSVKPDTPDDPGAWKDHATGDHGSLADLARRLGVDPRVSREETTREERPHLRLVQPRPKAPAGGERTLKGFSERRGITTETLERFRVAEVTHGSRPALRYPTACGVDRLKYLDGRKPKYRWTSKGGHAHWYGLKGALKLLDASPVVYLVNGEPSVWAAQQAGVPAVCLCAGENAAPSRELVAELAEAGVRAVRVVFDLDEAGISGAKRAVETIREAGLEAVALTLPPDLGPGGDVDDLRRVSGDEGLAESLAGLPEVGVASAEAVEPDLEILNAYRRPAPRLDLRLLRPWDGWLAAAAESTGSPVDYVAAGLVAVFAGTIGNGAEVSPWPGWCEPSVCWVGLVGNPGGGKSPALDPLRRGLTPLEREYREDHDADLQRWDEACTMARAARSGWEARCREASKKGLPVPPMPEEAREPERPPLRRVSIGNTTPEAMLNAAMGEPRGLLVFRDELASWLGAFGQYSGAVAAERGMWLESWGGRPYALDRVKGGHVYIPRLSLSVLGTAQPERLSRLLLHGDDDGLAARFLWCWPEPAPRVRPRNVPDLDLLTRALRWLRAVPFVTDAEGNETPQTLTLMPDATAFFEEWWKGQADDVVATGGLMASTLAKGPAHVLRLALVLTLARAAHEGGQLPGGVDRQTVAAAIALWEDYFVPMAERVFGDAVLPERDRNARTLARWIARERPKTINARDLRRRVRLPGLTEAPEVDAALAVLLEAGWLTPAGARDGDTAGRQRKDYRVRPEVLAALRGVAA